MEKIQLEHQIRTDLSTFHWTHLSFAETFRLKETITFVLYSCKRKVSQTSRSLTDNNRAKINVLKPIIIDLLYPIKLSSSNDIRHPCQSTFSHGLLDDI